MEEQQPSVPEFHNFVATEQDVVIKKGVGPKLSPLRRKSSMKRDEKYEVKLTSGELFASLLKSLMGIGILSVPSAYKNVGVLGGIFGTVFVVLVAVYSNYLIGKVLSKLGRSHKSYGDLAEGLLGPRVRIVVEATIICSQTLVPVFYIKYFGDQLNDIICERTHGFYCD